MTEGPVSYETDLKSIQGDKKMLIDFLREIIQPNLTKFACNLIRGRQVLI